MLVSIIGSHGIPARYGGFETFVEHLAIACAEAGIKVRVVNEKNNPLGTYHPNIEVLVSAFNKGENPLKFYRDSLMLSKDSDIILVCGVGGSFYYKQIRKTSVKIITNVDGIEHFRKKYNLMEKIAVYVLQNFAARSSNYIVTDSRYVEKYWKQRFRSHSRRIKMISYGADECTPFQEAHIEKYKLEKQGYFLVIARLVPENNIHLIIHAFKKYIGLKKLVIVGPLENNSYVRDLKKLTDNRVIFTDAIYDKELLDSLRQGCLAYIHGHSVGGTNPSLLEAMAAKCACICHDNVFNRETTDDTQIYFDTYFDLSILINLVDQRKADIEGLKSRAYERVINGYSWMRIYSAYIRMFEKLMGSNKDESSY